MTIETTQTEWDLFEKKGIIGLRRILSQPEAILITDLDDTTKEANKHLWPDGKERKLLPETVIAMLAIHISGVRLGIATEQAFSQIEPFISDLSFLATQSKDPYTLFNGLIVGEEGSVIYSKDRGQVILAPKKAIGDKEKIVNWLWENVVPSNIVGWSILKGTDPETSTYVQLPPKEDVCVATTSLWEKGPHISERPDYIYRYGLIARVVKKAIEELGITSLTTFEAGNGTLRIVPKFVNKAHSLELLSTFGVLELGNTVYACDGPNDVKLAEKLKLKGGGVIAVANAVPRLHEIANYSSQLPAGKGFADAISLIFPNEYLAAKKQLAKYLTGGAEATKHSRIVFFDADKTLWQTVPDTYASEGKKTGRTRTFQLESPNCATRLEDGAKFILKDNVEEVLRALSKEGVVIGIISDNEYEDVQKVAELFDIWRYFDKGFVNIWLSDGDAPKNAMIDEVITNQKLTAGSNILLVDDAERYAAQMASAGHDFILSPKDSFPKDLILGHFGLK